MLFLRPFNIMTVPIKVKVNIVSKVKSQLEIRAVVCEYLEDELGVDAELLGSGQALFTGGLLSSINAVRLIQFLKKTFCTQFEGEKITLNRIDTVDHIVSLVLSALAKDPI